jgi:transposase
MTQEEEIAQLKEQLRGVLEKLSAVSEHLSQVQERESHLLEQLSAEQAEKRMLQASRASAHKRIEELEKQKPPPPSFVKANGVKPQDGQKQPRKKRDPKYNRARQRLEPIQIVEHRIMSCPVCSSRLGGVRVARRRPVIELPPPSAIEGTEHVVYHGWCSECGTWREAPLDMSREVIGQGRMGVKLTSVIAYLRTVMRLPVRQIQSYLATLHGLKISSGEIVELLHRAKGHLEPLVAALKQEIRASPAVQADETGWREDGKNGYIWSVNTPSVRYYEYHHSRGSEVVKRLLGERFEGVLGSDFFASSNGYAGLHQRGSGASVTRSPRAQRAVSQ